jgi:acyl carrier protein
VPPQSSVHEQLTDILARVVGCAPDAVVPEAKLKDLGTDSLTIVEVGEELGRRFDIYLSDDTIDTMVTVKDAINAIVQHQAPPQPAATPPAPVARPVSRHELARRWGFATRMAIWLGVVGAAAGLVFGLGGAALVGATGLGTVNLPPLTMPTTETTSTPTPTPTPTPTSTDSGVQPEPTLFAAKDQVAPGERFALSGAFPELGKGATLQVQVMDKGSEWDDFPVDTKTDDGGKYKTEIYTSRTGERQFRMIDKKSGVTSPSVTVEIG